MVGEAARGDARAPARARASALDLLGRAGDHGQRRAVDRGEREPVSEERRGLLLAAAARRAWRPPAAPRSAAPARRPRGARPPARGRRPGRRPRTRRGCSRAAPRARSPSSIQSRARAYSTANSAGWATAVRASGAPARGSRAAEHGRRSGPPLLSSPGRRDSTSRRSSPRCGCRSSAQRSTSRAEDRLVVGRGRAPCPRTGPPGRGSRKATGRSPASSTRLQQPAADRARAGRGAASLRAVAADQRAAVREAPGGRPGACRRRPARLAPRCAPRCAGQRGPWPSPSAVAVRAERSRSCQGRDGPEGSGSGASSRTTWALVPPMPNELTPARRGAPSGRPRARARC